MTSQELLWTNLAIGALIALLFFVRRAQKEPSRLKLLKSQAQGSVLPVVQGVAKPAGHYRSAFRESISNEALEAASEGAPIKSLNVIFNYNGHSWDAYEVLGIPAGAPVTMANEAYERALKSSLPESHAFLRTAHQCILNSKK